MIKATFTYSTKLCEFHRLECEMSALHSALLQRHGMQLQFQLRNHLTDEVRVLVKGLLDSYDFWSESPTALALRAFYTLYTDWHQYIPDSLREHSVESAQVTVLYVHKNTETLLASTVATRDPGTVQSFQVQRSIDVSSWPLQIRDESAVPLGVLLKLLAFENSAAIDYSTFPDALNVPERKEGRKTVVSMSDIPTYAQMALARYIEAPESNFNSCDISIPAVKWRDFLIS